MSAAVTPGEGGSFSHVGKDSLRALQAGLASLFLLFTALATFGPWFQITIARVLTAASIIAGLAGLYWAHRASHGPRRNPGEAGQGLAKAGWLASLFGIAVSGAYNGVFLFALHPLGLVAAVIGTLVFVAVHEGALTQEDFFQSHFDPRDRTSSCTQCGRRAPLDRGTWGRSGWTCASCARGRRRRGAYGIVRGLLIVSIVAAVLLTLPVRPTVAFCEILEPPTDVPTEVKGTQIEIQLTEGFARVVIIKEFFNPSDQVKEGQVFFPLEKGHELITDLSLKIGNVVYNASGQDRQGALDNFLDALANGKDAALVQYDPPRDVYWVAVTIPPRESRTTITTLEMPLTKRDGTYSYDYRLSIDARDSTEYLRLHLRVDTSAPLEDLRTPSHPDLSILRQGTHRGEAWINSTEEARARDLTIEFRSSGPSMGQFATTSIVDNTTIEERYLRFSLDVGDPAFADSLRPLPRSFLFLVDASGSMGLRGRWPLAREMIARFGGDLGPEETFALAAFHGNRVATLAPEIGRWSGGSEAQVARFLDSIEPRGSTSLTVALPRVAAWAGTAEARGQQPILFLLSDGRPTVNALPFDIETAYRRLSLERDMPVFALALDPSDHGDETLLRNVSHFNHGDLLTVRPGGAARGVLDALEKIRVPVLLDVRAGFPGAAGVDIASTNPQNGLQGGEVVAIAKTRGAAGDPLSVGLSWRDPAGTDRAFSRTYTGAEIPSEPLLRKTWVLTRVHGLLDEISGRNDSAAIDELKTFATANRIVTPYTSLLVTIPRNPPPGGDVGGSTADTFDAFNPLAQGPISGPGAGPGASSLGGSRRPFTTPLDQQAEEAQAFWNDLGNPLVVENEVDRYLPAGSPEHQALEERAPALRFQGRYLSIVEADGELVGVYSGRLDPANALGYALWNGVWGGAAVAALGSLITVRKAARRTPRGNGARRGPRRGQPD